MTEGSRPLGSVPGGPVRLSSRAYRWLDRATKLAGVALVAGGLEVGGSTTAGLALAITGAVLATITIFIDNS